MIGFYDYRLVTLSVVIAICASYAALDLAGRTTAASGRMRLAWLAGGAAAMGLGIWSMHYIAMLAFSAVVMGAAIPVMHYTGMAAARFTPSNIVPDTAHAVSTSTLGLTGVSSVTLLVLGVTIMTSAFDRRFAAQRLQLNASERRFR